MGGWECEVPLLSGGSTALMQRPRLSLYNDPNGIDITRSPRCLLRQLICEGAQEQLDIGGKALFYACHVDETVEAVYANSAPDC